MVAESEEETDDDAEEEEEEEEEEEDVAEDDGEETVEKDAEKQQTGSSEQRPSSRPGSWTRGKPGASAAPSSKSLQGVGAGRSTSAPKRRVASEQVGPEAVPLPQPPLTNQTSASSTASTASSSSQRHVGSSVTFMLPAGARNATLTDLKETVKEILQLAVAKAHSSITASPPPAASTTRTSKQKDALLGLSDLLCRTCIVSRDEISTLHEWKRTRTSPSDDDADKEEETSDNDDDDDNFHNRDGASSPVESGTAATDRRNKIQGIEEVRQEMRNDEEAAAFMQEQRDRLAREISESLDSEAPNTTANSADTDDARNTNRIAIPGPPGMLQNACPPSFVLRTNEDDPELDSDTNEGGAEGDGEAEDKAQTATRGAGQTDDSNSNAVNNNNNNNNNSNSCDSDDNGSNANGTNASSQAARWDRGISAPVMPALPRYLFTDEDSVATHRRFNSATSSMDATPLTSPNPANSALQRTRNNDEMSRPSLPSTLSPRHNEPTRAGAGSSSSSSSSSSPSSSAAAATANPPPVPPTPANANADATAAQASSDDDVEERVYTSATLAPPAPTAVASPVSATHSADVEKQASTAGVNVDNPVTAHKLPSPHERVIVRLRQSAVVRDFLEKDHDFFSLVVGDSATAYQNHEHWLSNDNLNLDSLQLTLGNRIFLRLVPVNLMPPPPIRCRIDSSRRATDLYNKEFTLYVIGVQQGDLEWQVQRRFSEFDRLLKQLEAESEDTAALGSIPAELLPQLPPKQIIRSRRLSSEFVTERRAQLQDMLRALISIPEALSNRHILSFLGVVSTARQDTAGIIRTRSAQPRPVIHISKLRGEIRWGDIILFKCKNTLSGLQRRVTGAEFDHVGLVVKSSSAKHAEPELLEATGEGVTSFPAVGRIRAYATHDFTEYMVIRRLGLQIPTPVAVHMFKAMVQFVRKVDGKPYGFSMNKLLAHSDITSRRASGASSPSESTGAEDSARIDGPSTASRAAGRSGSAVSAGAGDRANAAGGGGGGGGGSNGGAASGGSDLQSFFCSELVAACLQHMGVIVPDLNVSAFWPGSFAENADIESALVEGATYGKEFAIDTRVLEISRAICDSERRKARRRGETVISSMRPSAFTKKLDKITGRSEELKGSETTYEQRRAVHRGMSKSP